jgi:hypothetical protein
MGAFVDLKGRKVGRWTVIEAAGKDHAGRYRWLCRCECGNEKEVTSYSLNKGKSLSCGCYHDERCREAFGTHLETHKTPEYNVWCLMRSRCDSPGDQNYARYGGRGITVCERWQSYENFLADMGRRPSESHTIDRVDNAKGYCPENCRWATKREQANNTRRNVLVTLDGKTASIAEWSRITGINQTTINLRLRAGWSHADALTKPLHARGRKRIAR